MVVAYVCFGSGIFYLLERDEPLREAAKFEEYYNKTMSSILDNSITNITEMQIIMAEIRRTFLQESYPIEWDFLGGVNITVHAITTIGLCVISTYLYSLICYPSHEIELFTCILY
jgi:hypothetical protein